MDGNVDSGAGGKEAGKAGLEELRYIQQIYQNQYSVVGKELEGKNISIRELDAAQRSLESIDSIKDKEALMPVGYDVYLHARIAESSKPLVGVGAGYLVEKEVDEAKQYIAKEIEKKTKEINNLMRAKKEIEAALIEISYRIDEAARE
jgi:prefoldin alpha subunit